MTSHNGVFRVREFGVALICLAALAGCSASSDKDVPDARNAESSGDAAKVDVAANDLGERIKEVDGRKWYGNVPLDVFLDNPLGELEDRAPVPNQPTTPDPGTSNPGTPTTPKTEPIETNVAGGEDWETLMPLPIYEAEMKRIRTKLAESLNTVGSYNLAMTDIPPDIGELAALANIAILRDDAPSWKDNAKFIRDLAAGMVAEPLLRGATTQRRLKASFESITDILGGNLPADLPESDGASDFGTMVDYGLMMKRIKRSSGWLKTTVVSVDSLKENSEEALREAYVMATIAKAIAHEDYGYSEDEDYMGYAKPLLEGSLRMAQAIKGENFKDFDAGISTVMQACSECHTAYRND